MKHITLILACLCLVSTGLAQSTQALDNAINSAFRGGRTPALAPSTVSFGVVDQTGSLVISGWSGSLFSEGATKDNIRTELAFTDPTAARTITFPNSSGTVLLTAIDQWVFEGSTADAYETTIDAVDPTADGTIWLPDTGVGIADANLSFFVSEINSGLNAPGLATSVWSAANAIRFEGATADAHEATIDAADATADTIFRLPVAAAGTYSLFTSTLATNAPDIANSVTGASAALVFEGTADAFETSLTAADATADRTVTIPNATGTVHLAQASTTTALVGDDQAVTPGSNTVIQLTSDDATATNRTFTLSATGAITGQIYVLIGPATNQCEIADTGIQVLSATWSPTTGDTLTLMFDGTNFNEIARSNN